MASVAESATAPQVTPSAPRIARVGSSPTTGPVTDTSWHATSPKKARVPKILRMKPPWAELRPGPAAALPGPLSGTRADLLRAPRPTFDPRVEVLRLPALAWRAGSRAP